MEFRQKRWALIAAIALMLLTIVVINLNQPQSLVWVMALATGGLFGLALSREMG